MTRRLAMLLAASLMVPYKLLGSLPILNTKSNKRMYSLPNGKCIPTAQFADKKHIV